MTLAGLTMQAYPSPEWVVFFEVSNSTGFGASRRADAVALGVWPSRGNALIGFEFKEDRRDWLREQKNPEKAEAIASKCDAWFVVAGADNIVKLEELPEPWGLKVANKERNRLITVKDAQPFPDRDKSVIQRTFVAAMLRKVGETTVPKVELQRLVDEAVKAAVERTNHGREIEHLREEVQQLQATIAAFKKHTGVDMKGWQGPEKIAAAVAAVLHYETDRQTLERAQRLLEGSAREISAALSVWPSLSTSPQLDGL